MHFSFTTLAAAATLASTVSCHGVFTKPIPRAAGAASISACGSKVVNDIKSDITSHVEGLPELAAKDSAYKASDCNLWLCRGLQFADNTANVQSYTYGQTVSMSVSLRIPHNGYANVSIVETKSNKIIGSQLLYWDHYADEKLKTMPANNTNFDITIPKDLGGKCTVAGECVIQWWWYGTGAKQTYESCIDFTVPMSMPMQNKRFFRM